MTERRENMVIGAVMAIGLALLAHACSSDSNALPRPENPVKIARCR